ncbi:hypothetical protein [Kitasatospora sp. NPDC093806]|uniref:hypothetical protein n=1 Tax=Kitasatospora sp. NPDC093806 TaxID=3155075 RepID=UPI00343371C9
MSRDETAGLRAAQLRLGRLPGYVRRPDPARRSGEQGHTYKKGWEVRFTARSEAEIAEIRDLVVAAGFAPARPFFKGHQLIQPVYGMAAVQAYLAARQAAEEHAARAAHGRARRGSSAARIRAAGKAAHEAVREVAEAAARCETAAREPVGCDATTHEAAADTATGAGTVLGTGCGAGAGTGTGCGADAETARERDRLAAAEEAAEAAGTAAAAVARIARRRAAETFPAQLSRGSAPDDRITPAEARKNT